MFEYTNVPEDPCIVASHHDWVVVFKPRGMHSSSHGKSSEHVLITWAQAMMPELTAVKGYWEHDYGLLHRLDNETAGLLLIAKTQRFFDYIAQSKTIVLKKFYSLYAEINPSGLPGSIPVLYSPIDASQGDWMQALQTKKMELVCSLIPPMISSVFRAYGQKYALVACRDPQYPDKHKRRWTGAVYTTTMLSCEPRGKYLLLNVMLERGFRHQIRSHCAWIGLPLIGDQLYNSKSDPNQKLTLVACGLEFIDLEGNLQKIML